MLLQLEKHSWISWIRYFDFLRNCKFDAGCVKVWISRFEEILWSHGNRNHGRNSRCTKLFKNKPDTKIPAKSYNDSHCSPQILMRTASTLTVFQAFSPSEKRETKKVKRSKGSSENFSNFTSNLMWLRPYMFSSLMGVWKWASTQRQLFWDPS